MCRKWRSLGLVMATAIGAACSASSERGPPLSPTPPSSVVSVTKVTDGDTLHVAYEGRDERVRLIGVDTPEVDWYGGEAECFGDEAGRFAQRLLSGQQVRLGFDRDLRDRYGRLLAYVYLRQELINLTLVRQGYAVADPVPPDTAMSSEFAAAELEARFAGRGLWSACPQP